MKRIMFSILLLTLWEFSAGAQDLVLTLSDEIKNEDIRLLHEFLGVQRFSLKAKAPKKKHDVTWVAHGISADGTQRRDTLFNTLAYHKLFKGGWPHDPLKDVVVLLAEKDSTHIRFQGNGWVGEVEVEPGEYLFSDGIDSHGKPVKRKLGEPIPVMVYSQPYVDKNNPMVSRYCFTNEIPATDWCSTFGVPYLVVLELTVHP